MKMIDITHRFVDNCYVRTLFDWIVLHWTASPTAQSAIDWLDQRKGGEGTVAYNYIIDRDGTIYELVNPAKCWVYHSGTGKAFDSKSISIAFVSWGIADEKKSGDSWSRFGDRYIQEINDAQVRAFAFLRGDLYDKFGEIRITHHAAINEHKIDMPDVMFDELMAKAGR